MLDYRTHVWSSNGHRFMGTDSETDESCLTCGALYALVPSDSDPSIGHYVASNGDAAQECTGRTDLVHGYERNCEADNGRECQESRENGTCKHTDHDCNCLQCQ